MLSSDYDAPGITFRSVLADASTVYVRSLLGEQICSLLDLIEGGEAQSDQLRDVAASAVNPEDIIAEAESRDRLLSQLSETKLQELSDRLQVSTATGPYETLRALVWTPDQRRTMLGFLGLIVDRAPVEPPPERKICDPRYGLFPHQRAAAERVQDFIYSGEQRVVLHLPTGVGKTRTTMHIVSDHLNRRGPTLVVWLAYGRELLEQAASEFERAWASLGSRPVTIARMWGDASADLSNLSDGIVIMGLQKAAVAATTDHRYLDRLGSRATLVVFDEAHQAIARTYRRVTDSLTLRRDASLIGLTATPGRTWADISSDERLADYFAHHKVMLEIPAHSNPVTALIEQGYLAKPTFRTVAARSGTELSDQDRRSLSRSFDVPDDILAKLTDDVQWNLQVVRTVADLVRSHQRILLFAGSVKHCRVLSAVISALGIDSAQVTADTPQRARDQAITQFKGPASQAMVLCNYGVLTTGFDAPKASAAIIARPTKSIVLYSQMVGRVIRGPKAGGTSACEIVTVVDPSLPGFGDVAEAFSNWEDVWEAK